MRADHPTAEDPTIEASREVGAGSAARDDNAPGPGAPAATAGPRVVTALWWLLLLGAVPFLALWNLDHAELRDWDEGIHASVSLAMVDGDPDTRSADWWTPKLGDEPYFRKPPLKFWITAALFRVLPDGWSDLWSIRLPSAVSGILAAWILALWMARARAGGRRWNGLVAAVCLVSMKPMFFHGLRTGETDGMLILSLVAFFAAWWAWIRPGDRPGIRPWQAVLCGAAVGVGAMSKGPVMLTVLPIAVAHAVVAPVRRPRWIELLLALAAAAGIAAPWHASMVWMHGDAFTSIYIASEVTDRVARPLGETVGRGPWFHIDFLVRSWAPLGALTIPGALWLLRDAVRGAEQERSLARLLLLWMTIGLTLVCAAATRNAWYVLPFLPPAVVAATTMLTRARPGTDWLADGGWLLGFWLLGLQLPAVLPGLEDLVVASVPSLALAWHPLVLGLLGMVAAATGWRLLGVVRSDPSIRSGLATAILLVLMLGLQGVVYQRQVMRTPPPDPLAAFAASPVVTSGEVVHTAEELTRDRCAGYFRMRRAGASIEQIEPASTADLAPGSLLLVGPEHGPPRDPDDWDVLEVEAPIRLLRRR